MSNFTSCYVKKYTVKQMAEILNLLFHAINFQCGWEIRNLHILFKYLVRTLINDMNSGNSISGRYLFVLYHIYCVYPLVLGDIDTDKQDTSRISFWNLNKSDFVNVPTGKKNTNNFFQGRKFEELRLSYFYNIGREL